MESNTPYQRLKKEDKRQWRKMYIFSVCFGKKENSSDDDIPLNEIFTILREKQHDVNARAANLSHQMMKLQEEAYNSFKDGDKEFARNRLKIKKYKEQSRDKLLNIFANICPDELAISDAHINKSVYKNMKQGNEVLRKLMSTLNVDDIDGMMAEFDGFNEELGDVNDSLGTTHDIDISNEMEALERDIANELEMPDVPNNNN